MKHIVIPNSYNYIGVFLTFKCTLRCSYCINHQYGYVQNYKHLSSSEWIKGLNRIVTRDDLPITIQGGEPSLYQYFYQVIDGIDHKKIHIDLLTNGQFDIDAFCKYLHPEKFARKAKYASIRISYHPTTMELESTLQRALELKRRGFSVGVWIVEHPGMKAICHASRDIMLHEGIDCRFKEFLGEYKGKFYGTYKYPDAVNQKVTHQVMCKPSELLIAPNGDIHRCHHYLYSNSNSYSNILNEDVDLMTEPVLCQECGKCNSCDIKLKTNRFQEFGHCSVEIT